MKCKHNKGASLTWTTIYETKRCYPNLFVSLEIPVVSCDNISLIYLSAKVIQHQRTKNIKINIYYAIFFESFASHPSNNHCLQQQCWCHLSFLSTYGPSISRSTYTLSLIKWSWGRSKFFMWHPT